jgi:DNA-binding MarR family transcriptional regulator
VDASLRDRRIVVACFVWGSALEHDADRVARSLTHGLNARDVLLLAALAFDRSGAALPGELVGPVHTTSAGVTGSLRRLEAAELIVRQTGTDRRTRPASLTPNAWDLIADIVEPWQSWFDSKLEHLDDGERTTLYRLLVKGSGLWNDVWPTEYGDEAPT